MMTKIINANNHEIIIEANLEGISLEVIGVTRDFPARLTLSEEQSQLLLGAISHALTMRQGVINDLTASVPLPDDPAALEATISDALTAYLAAEAEWKRLLDSEPKYPYLPDGDVTVAVWMVWRQECDAVDVKIQAWKTAHEAAGKEMTRRHNALGDLMPDAVKLVIPASGKHYSVWFTAGYSDISNLGSKYRSQIQIVSGRKKKTDQEIAEGMA
jgi:hypothetical protein